MGASDTLEEYVAKLVPPAWDRTTVAHRKQEIESALMQHGISVLDMFEAGSFSHGTGIRAKADVDLMVRVAIAEQPQLPSSALSRFKNALDNGLIVWSINVSSPTVRIQYYMPPHFEVVPAFYEAKQGGFHVYNIGGRRDEWVNSAPSAHNALVNAQNERLHKRVKPLVRLTKAWKYHSQAPVSSFYLEMRTTEYAKTQSSILYYVDLPAVFSRIVKADVADMNDPAGIAGRIPGSASDEKRRTTRKLLESALVDLDLAEAYRQQGNRKHSAGAGHRHAR